MVNKSLRHYAIAQPTDERRPGETSGDPSPDSGAGCEGETEEGEACLLIPFAA